MHSYQERLVAIKAKYPFQRWRNSGLSQYTDASCEKFVAVFDRLISGLEGIGEDAPEETKIERFKEAVLTLNSLNEEDESLIETGEREDLCELCNLIASEAGMDPEAYGDGEGPASEWREW